MRSFISSLIFGVLSATNALAAEGDLPRIPVTFLFEAFAGESEEQMKMRSNIMNYLAGIRDHLWWQCEYEVTIPQLLEGSVAQIRVFKTTMKESEFISFAEKTPYGDMVFISLKNSALYGKAEPCKP